MNYEQELLIKLYNCIGHLIDRKEFGVFDCQECGLNNDTTEVIELIGYIKSLNLPEDEFGNAQINK